MSHITYIQTHHMKHNIITVKNILVWFHKNQNNVNKDSYQENINNVYKSMQRIRKGQKIID